MLVEMVKISLLFLDHTFSFEHKKGPLLEGGGAKHHKKLQLGGSRDDWGAFAHSLYV